MKLLIKNARIIDPAAGRDSVGDIAVEGMRIALPSAAENYDSIFDGTGYLVTPGLIDFHLHLFDGGTDIGLPGDICLFPNGVTSAVDAGSAGCSNYPVFSRDVIGRSRLTIRAFANICPAGMATSAYHETLHRKYINKERLRELFERYQGELLGLKIRFTKELVGDDGKDTLEAAIGMAEDLGCPLVVHTTNMPLKADEILPMLRPGDVYCHVFQGRGNTIIDEHGEVDQAVFCAKERGILFDAASGRNHFSHKVAQTAISSGFFPDIISTDMTAGTAYQYPVYSLPHMLSRHWNMGMPLMEVIRAATSVPAKAMGVDGCRGSLTPGMAADLAVFQTVHKKIKFYDFQNEVMEGDKMLIPQMTIKDGNIVFRQADFLGEVRSF